MADNARIQERSLVINKIHKKYLQFRIVNFNFTKIRYNLQSIKNQQNKHLQITLLQM